LYLSHIVASEHWAPVVKEAVTEAVSRLIERTPCVLANDAVSRKSSIQLERGDCSLGSYAEFAGRITAAGKTKSPQADLDITD